MFDKNALLTIGKYLLRHEHTIAIAESVTSGLIQSAFSSVENASKFFQGGITTYNLGQKCRHLLIEPIHAQACNCVPPKIAEAMALNVCLIFNSDWGIGITGYAAPAPEANYELYAFYAIAQQKNIVLSKRAETNNKDPFKVQLDYINSFLNDFRKIIERLSPQ